MQLYSEPDAKNLFIRRGISIVNIGVLIGIDQLSFAYWAAFTYIVCFYL